jgi:nitrous oxidase accessory protein NosD
MRLRLLATASSLAFAAAIGGLSATTGEAARTVIEVFPGPQAIGRALAPAQSGDILNIHRGRYEEGVTVTTRDITLRSAGDGPVTIDGRCKMRFVIAVRADGVAVIGLNVVGAAAGFGGFPAEIDLRKVASGSVTNVVVQNTCDAEYGVNVYQSANVTVAGVTASGFTDAGIYLGHLDVSTGEVLVTSSTAFGNDAGILVESSTASAPGLIRIAGNVSRDNTTSGIQITDSDGLHIVNDIVTDNNHSGVELGPTSDGNRVASVTASGHMYDLANDGGTRNCFIENTSVTSFGDISC